MELTKKIKQTFKDRISVDTDNFQPTIFILNKDDLLNIVKILKDDVQFNFKLLADLTAVDYEEHIEVVYHLMSFDTGQILRVKVKLERGNPEIKSLCAIWKAACDQEREAYDMLGINFLNHPNLKRILCPDDFEGHPLRKDF